MTKEKTRKLEKILSTIREDIRNAWGRFEELENAIFESPADDCLRLSGALDELRCELSNADLHLWELQQDK